MSHCNERIYQQVTLSGYAEWPKVADAVIKARNRLQGYEREWVLAGHAPEA